MRAVIFFLTFAMSLLVSQLTWAQTELRENAAPLPEPPPNAPSFVESVPIVPFSRLENQNGSIRTVFQGVGPGGVEIELRDVIVAPHASVRFDSIKGPVVIDTRSGEGRMTMGDRSATLDVANVASMAADGAIEVQNKGETPLVMMIYVVEGR
jgi:hypothetical protein